MIESFTELSQFELDPAVAALLPLEYCIERNVAILGRLPADEKSPLVVGTLHPDNPATAGELAGRLKRPVKTVQLNRWEIRQAIARIHNQPLVSSDHGLLRLDLSRTIRFDAEQSPSDITEDIFAEALRRRATDVHIEVRARDVDLRFRIDGVLHQIPTPLSPENVGRVISRLKVVCELDISEHRRAQDGHFSLLATGGGRTRRIDVRLTVMPGAAGEEVAIRILDPERFILDLDHLSMPPAMLATWRELIRWPHGLVLTVGPTGVGKTTTLYATVKEIHHDGVKIVTAEDPIEYQFDKVSQKSVSKQMNFADWLRAFLRANPDVMLVGEIRDAETAEVAIRAATTGHLILSTLHTGDAVAAIGRLRVLGVSNDLLSDVLVGILSQRLMRRLCPKCRKPGKVPAELARGYYREPPKGTFYQPVGCEDCHGTGYLGLTGAFELLVPGPALATAIAEGVPVEELRKLALKEGWAPLVDDALRRVEEGETSLAEVARRIPPKFARGHRGKGSAGKR